MVATVCLGGRNDEPRPSVSPFFSSPSRHAFLAEVQLAKCTRYPRSTREHHHVRAHGRSVREPHARRRLSILADEARDGLPAHDSAPQRDHARSQLLDAACSVRPARVQVDVPGRAIKRNAGLDVRRKERGACGVAGTESDRANTGGDVIRICLGGVELRVISNAWMQHATSARQRQGMSPAQQVSNSVTLCSNRPTRRISSILGWRSERVACKRCQSTTYARLEIVKIFV